jgi:hypothetical protein
MKSMADRAGFNPARGQIMKGGADFLPVYVPEGTKTQVAGD